MMLYCFLAGLVFASSYCSAQVPLNMLNISLNTLNISVNMLNISVNTLNISLNTLNSRIEVLEKELEHGGRRIQSLSLNSKLH